MLLMLEDKPVLKFDFDSMVVQVINRKLLPYSLRGKLKTAKTTNMAEQVQVTVKNIIAIKEYLSNRVLSLSRDNAKGLFALLGVPQSNNIDVRVDICIKCRGVSLTDAYWIKEDNDNRKWEDVNIRNKSFSKVVMDVALGDKNPTITTNYVSPEFTNKGLFRKAWVRNCGVLELMKTDRTSVFICPKMEVLASEILECFNGIDFVKYRLSQRKNMIISVCSNFVKDGTSFVEASELYTLYGKEFFAYMFKYHKTFIANTAVIDYILMNTDRHMGNYGFIMDNKTGKLINYAPLFDFNLALVSDYYDKVVGNSLSQMFNDYQTIEGLAIDLRPYAALTVNMEKFNALYLKYVHKDERYIHVLNCVKDRIDFMSIPQIFE